MLSGSLFHGDPQTSPPSNEKPAKTLTGSLNSRSRTMSMNARCYTTIPAPKMAKTSCSNPWLQHRAHPLSDGHLPTDARRQDSPACRRLSCPTLAPEFGDDTHVGVSCTAPRDPHMQWRSYRPISTFKADGDATKTCLHPDVLASFRAGLLDQHEQLSRSQDAIFALAMTLIRPTARDHWSHTAAFGASDGALNEIKPSNGALQSLHFAQSQAQLALDTLKAMINELGHLDAQVGITAEHSGAPAQESDQLPCYSASSQGIDGSRHEQDTDTDYIPTPLQTYYDTAGWISILRERLETLQYEHFQRLGEQKTDLPEFRMIAGESAEQHEAEEDNVRRELLRAKEKAAVYLDICIRRDIAVPHRVPASDASEPDSRMSLLISGFDRPDFEANCEGSEEAKITQERLVKTEHEDRTVHLGCERLTKSEMLELPPDEDFQRQRQQHAEPFQAAHERHDATSEETREASRRNGLHAERRSYEAQSSPGSSPPQKSLSDRSRSSWIRQPAETMPSAQFRQTRLPFASCDRRQRLQQRVDAWVRSAGFDPKMELADANDSFLVHPAHDEDNDAPGRTTNELSAADISSPSQQDRTPEQESAVECPVCGSAIRIPG